VTDIEKPKRGRHRGIEYGHIPQDGSGNCRTLTVNAPLALVKKLDILINAGYYETRSELIRDGIRHILYEYNILDDESVSLKIREVDSRAGGMKCPNCGSFIVKDAKTKFFKCRLCDREFVKGNFGLKPVEK
jgi:Arc/MetJ-type ribon-helix-helix transcriptional regulator